MTQEWPSDGWARATDVSLVHPLVEALAIVGSIQAVARKEEIGRLMPDDSPRSLAVATGLGAASSSCADAAAGWLLGLRHLQ